MYRYIQIGSAPAYSHSLPRQQIENSLRALPETVADRLENNAKLVIDETGIVF